MNFSLDQLQAFVTTVEQGSFKQAAIRLGKHATTISQQVAALEIDTGLTLFDRKVRKLELTDAGRDFYTSARPVLNEADHLNSRLSGMLAKLPGSFRLALGTTVRDRQLLRCAKHVAQAYPTIELHVLSGDPLEVLEQVRNRQADIGVITTLFQSYPGLSSVQLFNFELVMVASPIWVGDNTIKTEQEIRAFSQIVYQYVHQTESLHGHILANHYYQAQNLADLLDMVSLGLGWAIVPRYQVEELLGSGELQAFTLSGGKTVNWYSELVYRDDEQLNPAMQLFIDQALKLPDR